MTKEQFLRLTYPSSVARGLLVLLLAWGIASPVAAQIKTAASTAIESDPQYPGGIEECFKFVGTNLKYPADCQGQGIQGRVIVQFIIDKDGSVTDAQVVQSVHPQLDKEALRLVNAMPKWLPGMSKGKPIRVRFTMPINFKLGTDKPQSWTTVIDENNEEKTIGLDRQPQFPGGNRAMTDYLEANIKRMKRGSKEARVTVQFVVNTDGSLSKLKVTGSTDSRFNGKALRLVRRMPRWEPAIQNGKSVRVKHSIPVTFRPATVQPEQDVPAATKELGEKGKRFANGVDTEPQFPGGPEALTAFLNRNVTYPADCREQGIGGSVIVQFIVNTDGRIAEPKVIKKVHPSLDLEALSVVRYMPAWIPATKNGKFVRVKYVLPVTFSD